MVAVLVKRREIPKKHRKMKAEQRRLPNVHYLTENSLHDLRTAFVRRGCGRWDGRKLTKIFRPISEVQVAK